MKKKKISKTDLRNFGRGFQYGVVLGGPIGALAMAGFILLFWTFAIYTIEWVGGYDIIDTQITEKFEKVAGYWQRNEFVESLSYICSLQETEMEKVECVYFYINKSFKFKMHHTLLPFSNQLRENPEEVIKEKGVCRDWVVVFSSVLRNLNIDYEMKLIPKHVYLEIYPDDYMCVFDTKKPYRLDCELR